MFNGENEALSSSVTIEDYIVICTSVYIEYSQRHTMINHCDRHTVQSETYHDKSL